MSTKNTTILVVLLILISTLIGVILLPRFPEQMASHWNLENQVDGYMPRFWGVFLMPIMSVALFLLFLVLPQIDPLKENIAAFRGTFNVFIVLLMAFLAYLYLLTLVYNLGNKISISTAMLPALGAFFFYAGVLIGKARRNWFIGIRNPWTMSNDKVWNETHHLGAILFKLSGVLTIIGAFFENYSFWFVMIPLLGSSLFLTVYSYLLFRRENRRTH
jgi:uncharacterized membrane protein